MKCTSTLILIGRYACSSWVDKQEQILLKGEEVPCKREEQMNGKGDLGKANHSWKLSNYNQAYENQAELHGIIENVFLCTCHNETPLLLCRRHKLSYAFGASLEPRLSHCHNETNCHNESHCHNESKV